MRYMASAVAATVALFMANADAAQQQDFSKVEVKTTDLGRNTYILEGAGGNVTIAVGTDGVIMVDAQFAPMHDKLKAAITKITNLPVKYLINTHYHEDHTGGNANFQHDAPILAHDNVRKRLEEGGTAGNNGGVTFKAIPQPKEALPIITFDHDVTVHLNGEDIRALHFPSGHTDGDSVIFFPKSNVVHMGDDFVTYGFPFIDIDGGPPEHVWNVHSIRDQTTGFGELSSFSDGG